MRGLALATFILMMTAAPASASHGLMLDGVAIVNFQSGPFPMTLHGQRTDFGWLFTLSGGSVVLIGYGDESSGFQASSPICCIEMWIAIGPLRLTGDSSVHTFSADFLYCDFICFPGSISGTFLSSS